MKKEVKTTLTIKLNNPKRGNVTHQLNRFLEAVRYEAGIGLIIYSKFESIYAFFEKCTVQLKATEDCVCMLGKIRPDAGN